MASALMIISAMSCQQIETPSIEFARSLYSVRNEASTDITLVLSKESPSDITVPLSFASKAELGTEYTVSSESIIIKAGETSGAITLTNNSLGSDDEIRISIKEVPAGYTPGSRSTTIVSPSSQQALIYSFQCESADVLDKYIATIELKGTVTENFTAAERLSIPATLSGEGASLVSCSDGGNFIVEAGESKGTMTLTLKDANYTGAAKLNINITEDGAYIGGNTETMEITVKGVLSPAVIAGTWEFEETINLEELEMWFEEYEDDASLLPVHNDGFRLTFSGNNGAYTVTPSGEGDWNNYFRSSAISWTKPVNTPSGAVILGNYTADESNMFIAEVDTPRQQMTYFRLDKVNRAFSADTETAGAGAIAMRLRNDGRLEIHIRDYSTPPFGEMWWDDEKFDADMFSFASTFKKIN